MIDSGDFSGKENVDSVLSAIKDMVHKETTSRFKGTLEEEVPFLRDAAQSSEKSATPDADEKLVFAPGFNSEYVPAPTLHSNPEPDHNVPSKIYVLQPYMRVDKKMPAPEILEPEPESTGVMNVSFAIGNATVDEDMLRGLVREVVQEQLRGELGREILNAVRMDLIGFIDE